MPSEVLQALTLSLAGLFSPGAILLVLVVLASERGGRKAFAFWLGYTGGLCCAGCASLVVGAGRVADAQADPSVRPHFLVFGTLLLWMFVRTWRKPDDGGPIQALEKLDGAAAPKLGGVGLVVSVINFKNLALFLAAVSPLAAIEGGARAGVPWVALCAPLFTSGIFAPIGLYAIGRRRAQPLLLRLRGALERNKRTLSLVILPLFGAAFLWQGVAPLFR